MKLIISQLLDEALLYMNIVSYSFFNSNLNIMSPFEQKS